LRATLSAGNAERAMAAPVVVIVAHDPAFYEQLPRLYPQADARSWFAQNHTLAEETAFRNGTLQGAYLILAARAVGLECAPMSGFNRGLVERDILADYGWKANFLVCLGHGDPATAPARGPRLEFEQACVLL
jgi:3-hydroxypropanoate dehydrogenase